MTRRDPFDLILIEGNILDWKNLVNRRLASVARRNVSGESLDQFAPVMGYIDHRYVDNNGKLRMVISPNDLYNELGVHAYLAGLAADGATPTVWIDADTGLLTAGGGAVIIGQDGIVIQADGTTPYMIFKTAAGVQVASIFQDGAGNLQFDLVDDTKGFTFNDGNVVSGHGTGKDSAFALHENFVAKGRLLWDASAISVVVQNFINDGSIVLVLKGNDADVERVSIFNDTAGYGTHRFMLNGSHHFREQASAPPDPDANYLSLYALDDHTLHVVDSDGNDIEVGSGGGDASDVTYTPTTEADWDTPPAAVDEGLDELAGRVTDLEATHTHVKAQAEDPTVAIAGIDFVYNTVSGSIFMWTGSAWVEVGSAPVTTDNYYLLESGDFLLLENGDKFILG